MPTYSCEMCNYTTTDKSNHSKHLKTKSHLLKYYTDNQEVHENIQINVNNIKPIEYMKNLIDEFNKLILKHIENETKENSERINIENQHEEEYNNLLKLFNEYKEKKQEEEYITPLFNEQILDNIRNELSTRFKIKKDEINNFEKLNKNFKEFINNKNDILLNIEEKIKLYHSNRTKEDI